MYIPRSKSVLLERLLGYTNIPRSKRELHQRLMKYMDIPCSKSVLRERGLIHRLGDCGTAGGTRLTDLNLTIHRLRDCRTAGALVLLTQT